MNLYISYELSLIKNTLRRTIDFTRLHIYSYLLITITGAAAGILIESHFNNLDLPSHLLPFLAGLFTAILLVLLILAWNFFTAPYHIHKQLLTESSVAQSELISQSQEIEKLKEAIADRCPNLSCELMSLTFGSLDTSNGENDHLRNRAIVLLEVAISNIGEPSIVKAYRVSVEIEGKIYFLQPVIFKGNMHIEGVNLNVPDLVAEKTEVNPIPRGSRVVGYLILTTIGDSEIVANNDFNKIEATTCTVEYFDVMNNRYKNIFPLSEKNVTLLPPRSPGSTSSLGDYID